MTREDAIIVLNMVEAHGPLVIKAKEMAIEALKQPERKKGKWLNDKGLYKCSSCNELWTHWWAVCMEPERMYKEMKYCPYCGAKMEETK